MKQNASLEVLDQKPPSDPDAELMVLRELIRKPELIASEDLSTDLFNEQANVEIFRTLALLHEERQPTDLAHVWQRLRDEAKYETIGGKDKLAAIVTGDRLPSKFATYLECLRDKLKRRKAVRLGENLLQNAYGDMPTDDLLEWASERLKVAQNVGGEGETVSPVNAGQLIASHASLHEPIIQGVLRREETANIIAAPKMGKSWLTYGLALSVATERFWLSRYQCKPGRVLLIDNELHEPTLAHRLGLVAEAMGLERDAYSKNLQILPLRGRLLDLYGIAELLEQFKPGTFDLIVLDAFYRALPPGVSENDNNAIAQLYNRIDAITRRMQCAWVNIHHASKGNQAEKAVTDVGAGAGSQSRAADTHLILRPHEEEGAVVLDAVVRSFAPIEPIPLRFEFPVWKADGTLDASKVRGRLTKGEERQLDRDAEGKQSILDALEGEPLTHRQIRALGFSKERADRLLAKLESDGLIGVEEITARGGKQARYYPLPKLVGLTGRADHFGHEDRPLRARKTELVGPLKGDRPTSSSFQPQSGQPTSSATDQFRAGVVGKWEVD